MHHLYALMTDYNARAIADDIIENLGPTEGSTRLLDVDFRITKGVMVPTKTPNTWFAYDFGQGSVGASIVEALSDDSLEVTEETKAAFLAFLGQIVENINARGDVLKEAITRAVLGTDQVQITSAKATQVFLMDTPEIDFLLVISKKVPKDSIPQSVQQDLMQDWLETKDDFDVILKRQQEQGKCQNVESVQRKKIMFQCDVRLLVDYSLQQPAVPAN